LSIIFAQQEKFFLHSATKQRRRCSKSSGRRAGWSVPACRRAYSYFGGVARMLVPDNLSTGVFKNTRSELVLNKAYQELAEHYGTAIMPTRVRSPKDKATVEGAVGNDRVLGAYSMEDGKRIGRLAF